MAVALSAPTMGIILSLFTAFCWAISPLCWASAGRRVGSFPVLLLRSALASGLLLILLPVYAAVNPAARVMPAADQVTWIILSGLAGMALGDGLGYEALVRIGARRAMQIGTLAPIASVLFGYFLLDETFAAKRLWGIAIVLGATTYAVMARQRTQAGTSHEPGQLTISGILFAVGGAVGLGLGAVAARKAYMIHPERGELDPILVTTLRVVSSTLVLWLIPLFRGRMRSTVAVLRDRHILSRMALGTLVGPFIGMICYVAALKYTAAGIVSTLSSTSPLFILPMIMLLYKTKLTFGTIVATALAIVGVGLISWQ